MITKSLFLSLLFSFFVLLISAHAQTSAGQATLSGLVVDVNGAAVAGATVRVRRASSDETVATTGADGRYRFESLSMGTYDVTAEAQGFQTGHTTVDVAGASVRANLALGAATLAETVTVTAQRGESESAFNVPEALSVIGEREMTERRAVVLPQLLQGEPGVAVQQTTTSQGSPYVRGLTGQQVVNLIDGVRYNTSTFRPGPNQYTALIEPGSAGRIERDW
jgi:iron complex outermembrane receptor protein/hemoglobin/transferrin/lactoferrin receptor protein